MNGNGAQPASDSGNQGAMPLLARAAIWSAIVAGSALLLWFVVFPWVEGLLPAEF